jgi:WD40 repeat protein
MRVFRLVPRRVTKVRFTPDGRIWATLRNAHFVTHFDAHGIGPVEHDRRVRAGMTDFAFAPHAQGSAFGTADGRVLYRSGSDDTASCTFDIGRTQEFAAEHIRPVSAVRFANPHDPKRCWLAMAASQFCLWNPYSQEYIFNPTEGDYRGVTFGPDGAFVASLEHHAHAVAVWNVKPFRVLFRTELTGIGDFTNGSVAVLPDGDRIIYAAGDQLRCVSMAGGSGWEATLKKPAIDLSLHPNGATLLIADGTKKVTQFDTTNGRPVQQFDWGVGKVSCVDVSADGTLFAAGGEKGQVVVWDGE